MFTFHMKHNEHLTYVYQPSTLKNPLSEKRTSNLTTLQRKDENEKNPKLSEE